MTDTTYSVEDAIAALSGDDVSDEAQVDGELPEDEQDEIDAEAEFQADADDDSDDPETDPDADDDEESDEPETAIEAPQFLDEKERADFAALPRAAQEMLLKHDKALVADYTRKTQALADDRKAAQAQRTQLEQVVSRFGEVVPELEGKVNQWQNLDWPKLARQLTAEEYNAYRAQAESDVRKLNQVRQQKAQAEQASFQTFIDEQSKLLPDLATAQGVPELQDPKKRDAVLEPLFKYVKELGYEADEIRHIAAQDMVIAFKAMKYDQMVAQSKGRSALTPKPDAKSTGKPVRAGAASSTSKRAASRDVQKKFRQTGSTSLAIAMLQDID